MVAGAGGGTAAPPPLPCTGRKGVCRPEGFGAMESPSIEGTEDRQGIILAVSVVVVMVVVLLLVLVLVFGESGLRPAIFFKTLFLRVVK